MQVVVLIWMDFWRGRYLSIPADVLLNTIIHNYMGHRIVQAGKLVVASLDITRRISMKDVNTFFFFFFIRCMNVLIPF